MTIIMKNFRESGRSAGSGRRRQLRNPRRNALPIAEYLESRQLLSGGATYATAIPAPLWQPMNTNVFDAQNGPMANLGTNLVSIYQTVRSPGRQRVSARVRSIRHGASSTTALVGMAASRAWVGNFGQFVSPRWRTWACR